MARMAAGAVLLLVLGAACSTMAQQEPAMAEAAAAAAGDCRGKCGATYIAAGGGYCHCDYFCNNRGDCCGGSASKNALCPEQKPTLDKAHMTTCDAPQRNTAVFSPYRAGMCWCDAFCTSAGDCCPSCAVCKPRQLSPRAEARRAAAAAAAEVEGALSAELLAASPLWQKIQAQVAAAHEAKPANERHHDCGMPHNMQQLVSAMAARNAARASPMAAVDVAAVASGLHDAEVQMQACQAADRGPPAHPIKVPLFWTAGQVCDGSGCVGGAYSKALVARQIELTNAVFAHVGIQFVWDGVIHKATAGDAFDIDVGYSTSDWICQQQRHGDALAVNVMTAPIHPGGSALGVTMYPSYFVTGQLPMCANWVFIFEKTLPDQGARSKIDNLLCDGGATLTHEIGHQMMLAHTWNQLGGGSVAQQCQASASMDPSLIVDGYSDGVRDTVAQSLNGTNNPVTNILRFVACDPKTGAYANTTAYAQQSCHSGTGFPAGDAYYNNYNNLMSYGDRYCLRTLTPGQGARARCAIKCMRLGQC